MTIPDKDDALFDALRASGKTVAFAESLTGGLAGARAVARAGASAYFLGSAVCYCDRAKRDVLGVDAAVLREKGAVSAECAQAMARGALRLYASDIALSTTGFAGPEGAPAGEVFIGWATAQGACGAERFLFAGGRDAVRAAAVDALFARLSNLL